MSEFKNQAKKLRVHSVMQIDNNRLGYTVQAYGALAAVGRCFSHMKSAFVFHYCTELLKTLITEGSSKLTFDDCFVEGENF